MKSKVNITTLTERPDYKSHAAAFIWAEFSYLIGRQPEDVLKWFEQIEDSEFKYQGGAYPIYETFVATAKYSGNTIPIGTASLVQMDSELQERMISAGNQEVNSHMLFALCVQPQFRGKSVGTSLVKAAEHFTQQAGINSIGLDSTESAIPLYEKLGYQVHGVCVPSPFICGEQLTPMCKTF